MFFQSAWFYIVEATRIDLAAIALLAVIPYLQFKVIAECHLDVGSAQRPPYRYLITFKQASSTQRMRRLGCLIRDFTVTQKSLKNFTHQFQIIRVARYGKFYGLQHMVNFIFHNNSIPKQSFQSYHPLALGAMLVSLFAFRVSSHG